MYEKPILDGFVPENNELAMRRLYRDMYLHDPIAGAAVDLQAQLPFSDFTLSGLPDQNMLRTFASSLEAIHVKTLLPELATEYQVDGMFIGYANFDDVEKRVKSIMPQNADVCTITELPIYGRDPIIDVQIPEAQKKLFNSTDSRIKEAFAKYGDDMKDMIRVGKFPLDPKFTLYVARRTFATTTKGMSYYRRIIPIWLWEKALLRGTIDLSYRRQKSILHLVVGDEEWEPNNEELTSIVDMFIKADVDPTGAVVATRPGIQTSEIRSGSDFWRYDEIYDFASGAKMRALGISDGFLSGESCMVGNTIVPTSKGLLEIGPIGDPKNGRWQDTKFKVLSRYGVEKAVKWFYNGVKPTIKITTGLGNVAQATHNHQMLVFNTSNGETDWERMDALKRGDLLCINTKGMVRTTPLVLNLPDPSDDALHGGQRKILQKPKFMTPSLAFFLGAIQAEGSISRKGYQIRFSNSDEAFIERVRSALGKVFNTYGAANRLVDLSPYPYSFNQNKNCYELIICSKTLVEWLDTLGMYCDGNQEKTASHYKTIPWSIMQADEQSQIAFMAAYIEGDGSIAKNILIISASNRTLEQFQALLLAHTIVSNKYNNRVQVSGIDADVLWNKIAPYMVSKRYAPNTERRGRCKYGIPCQWLVDLLNRRKIKHDRHGIDFADDDGDVIHLRGFKNICHGRKQLGYDAYGSGLFDKFLVDLKLISRKAWKKLVTLFDLGYRFVPIKSISKGGNRPTFDLSIQKGHEPAYVANGMVVHNTYNNMETSLSVFLEQIRAFREFITRKVFYQRLFPLIAMENGFEIREKKIETKGSFNDGRIQGIMSKAGVMKYQAVIGSSNFVNLSNDDNEVDITKLHMPKMHWHKALKPEADSAYISMLSELQQSSGLPIPLRIWAAAGGLPITDIMQSLDEDVKLRKLVDAYKKKLPKNPEEEAAQLFSGASTSGYLRTQRNRNRSFESIEMKDPDTQKVLSRKGRNVMEERANKKASPVLANLAKRDNAKELNARGARQRAYHFMLNKTMFGNLETNS